MPEHEARVWAFYDHETEEPRATGRRRRQVADWGVGEDVFDRMPSRRFARRGLDTQEHRRAQPRPEAADWDDDGRTRRFARAEDVAPRGDDDAPWVRGDDHAPRMRREVDAPPRRDDDAPRMRREVDAPPRRDDAPRRERRPAADWLAEVTPRPAPEPIEEPGEDAERTIVLGGAVEEEPEAPKPRRTIVIGGHPDKLPAPRPRRPPRTAVERLGATPDRIMGYAVALGLLLILIAVLTTSH
jgi:hypothetical protein